MQEDDDCFDEELSTYNKKAVVEQPEEFDIDDKTVNTERIFSVSFSLQDNEVYEVPSLASLSYSDMVAVWYTQDEYLRMIREAHPLQRHNVARSRSAVLQEQQKACQGKRDLYISKVYQAAGALRAAEQALEKAQGSTASTSRRPSTSKHHHSHRSSSRSSSRSKRVIAQ